MEGLLSRIGTGFSYIFRTDKYTRGLQLYNDVYRNNLAGASAIYETINNNEYELYKSTAELSIVINRKASMLTNGRSVIRDWKTGKEIENHPLLKLLENPNALMNRNAWLMDISIKHDVYGNVYIYKNKGSYLSEYPSILMNLQNNDIKINLKGRIFKQVDLQDIVKNYELISTKEIFKTNEIIHIKNVNIDDPIRGISPLHNIQMAISNIRGAYGYRNVNITKHGALGVISPKGADSIGAMTLSDTHRKELEKEFVKDHGIFDNQSPVKFANIPIEYQNLSHPIKDSLLFEEIDEDFKRIIDHYQMNENVFSRKSSSKFSNLNEGLKMCYQDAVIPSGEKISYAVNQGLGLFEKGIYHEFDFSHVEVLQDNEEVKAKTVETKAKSYKILVENGISPKDAEIITGLRI